MKVVAVIPARMGSSRFPGKPLKKILDLPMVEHVRRRALLCKAVDEVVVATCDQEIIDAVNQAGGKAVMTSDKHERCTDRVEEAVRGSSADLVIVLQGDEPLLGLDVIDQLITPFEADQNVLCTNLISVIHDETDLDNRDIVKAVLNQKNDVLCFSRSAIPYRRVKTECPLYRQTGFSVFRRLFLEQFSQLPPTPLEILESVDFLRILEHGYSIHGVIYRQVTVGVDRPGDIAVVENILKNDPVQKKIYEMICQ
ncbi:MAG: 3-deoxy-manno-octulosonate cytidylyltransferase [Candidatus Omnitrophica bacterium]|nr:3-deoxy-manno-octulosonate cytidylyltransferase [Candidatus Omnitrophota bacterium]